MVLKSCDAEGIVLEGGGCKSVATSKSSLFELIRLLVDWGALVEMGEQFLDIHVSQDLMARRQ